MDSPSFPEKSTGGETAVEVATAAAAPPSAGIVAELCTKEESARNVLLKQRRDSIDNIAPFFSHILRVASSKTAALSPSCLFSSWMTILALAGSPSVPRHFVTDLLGAIATVFVQQHKILPPAALSSSALLPLMASARSMLPPAVTRSAAMDGAVAFSPMGTSLTAASVLRAWAGQQSDGSTPLSAASSAAAGASAATAESAAASFTTSVVPSWLDEIVRALAGGRANFEAAALKFATANPVAPSSPSSTPDADSKKKKSRQEKEREAERDRQAALHSYLAHTLGKIEEKHRDCVEFDTDRCRVLHSKERTPVLLAFKSKSAAAIAAAAPTSASPQLPDCFILKPDDDMRLESLVMMILRWANDAMLADNVSWRVNDETAATASVFAACYDIVVLPVEGGVSHAGLVEFIPQTRSVHEIRGQLREDHGELSDSKDEHLFAAYLKSCIVDAGPRAVAHFMASFVGASATSYLLALKDRHNANILLQQQPADDDKEVLLSSWCNIDYGFCLGRAPGGAFSLETAPFRIPDEIFSVFFAKKKTSPQFLEFSRVFAKAAMALRGHFNELELALSAVPEKVLKKLSCVASSGKERDSPHQAIIRQMKKRLLIADPLAAASTSSLAAKSKKMTTEDPELYFASLPGDCASHSGSKMYDSFQKKTNRIN